MTRRSFAVFPDQQTFSGSAGMSQTCTKGDIVLPSNFAAINSVLSHGFGEKCENLRRTDVSNATISLLGYYSNLQVTSRRGLVSSY
jgi:hypothetical protein